MDRTGLGYTEPPERKSRFDDLHKIQKGENIFRLIAGPEVRDTYWYPSFFQDEEGMYNPGNRGITTLPENKSLIHQLYGLEWSLLRKGGIKRKDANCIFNRNTDYIYLGFKLDDEEQKIKPVRVTRTIHERIDSFCKEVYKEKPQYLRNGLLYMFDIRITKKVDPDKPKIHGTKYETDVYDRVFGKHTLPITILDDPNNWVEILKEAGVKDASWEKILTKDQLTAIDECGIELSSVNAPKTNDEVISELEQNPIFLEHADTYFNLEDLVIGAKKLGSPIQLKLPDPETDEVDADEFNDGVEEVLGEEVKTDEADFEDIPDEKKPEEAKEKTSTDGTTKPSAEDTTDEDEDEDPPFI